MTVTIAPAVGSGEGASYTLANDTTFEWEATPLVQLVDTQNLANPAYGVAAVSKINEADDQQDKIDAGEKGRQVSILNKNPTRCIVQMRPLATEPVLQRVYTIRGTVHRSLKQFNAGG